MSEGVERLLNDAQPVRAQFTWAGHTFDVHRVDLRVMAALEAGRLGRAIELMIGKDQIAELLAIDTDEVLTYQMVTDGMKAWAKANGTSVGESGASTES